MTVLATDLMFALEKTPVSRVPVPHPVDSAPAGVSSSAADGDAPGTNGSPKRVALETLSSDRLRSIVRAARGAHGPHRVRWSDRDRRAWHELVVVRGNAA